ncbi:MAG TPA: putative metal-binding motif-containing protein [Polyangia bacterium]|jgi:hypothetical protein
MPRLLALVGLSLSVVLIAACGSDSKPQEQHQKCTLCDDKPACEGSPATLKAGTAATLIRDLKIGTYDQGFDFNGDGKPENALAAIGALANNPINESITKGELIVPFEFYGLDTSAAGAANQTCTHFSVLVGKYPQDADGDGARTGRTGDKGKPGLDCNDRVDDPLAPSIHPGAAETAGNGVDDNCNGIADETFAEGTPDGGCETPRQEVDGGCLVPGADETDADGDGVTVAQGDCDDRATPVITAIDPATGTEITKPIGWFSKPGNKEICGDGLDNDCNGAADDGCNPYCDPKLTTGVAACSSSYVTAHGDTLDAIAIDPLSVDGTTPKISFMNGSITDGLLHAGPSVFNLTIPIQSNVAIDFRITAAIIEGKLTVDDRGGVSLTDAMLGGVLDAHSMGRITGLDISDIQVTPEDTLLDVIMVGFLARANLLGLKAVNCHPLCPPDGCLIPDIDVDGDGFECFIDETPNDSVNRVSLCVDGDGTEVRDGFENDENGKPKKCTEALLPNGKPRFVDGLSITLTFNTLPTRIGAVDQP